MSKKFTLGILEAAPSGNLHDVDKVFTTSHAGIVVNEKEVPGIPMQNGNFSGSEINSGPSIPKRMRKTIEKSPTERLLEDQVKLLQEQVKCFHKIIQLMEERNGIEKDKCSALQKKILVDVEDVEEL